MRWLLVVFLACGGESAPAEPIPSPLPETPTEAEPAPATMAEVKPVTVVERPPPITADCPVGPLFRAMDEHRRHRADARVERAQISRQEGGALGGAQILDLLRQQVLPELASTAALQNALERCGQPPDPEPDALHRRMDVWLAGVLPSDFEEPSGEEHPGDVADELQEAARRISDRKLELARGVLMANPPSCARDQYAKLLELRDQNDRLELESLDHSPNTDVLQQENDALQEAISSGSPIELEGRAADAVRELVQRCPQAPPL